MPFSAVIFDLDGTLLDTLADLGGAANRVLASHGFPTHPLEAFRWFVGDGSRMLITRALPADQREREFVVSSDDGPRVARGPVIAHRRHRVL